MDSGAELPIVDKLIVGDLKYHNSISSVMKSKGDEALANRTRVLNRNRGPSNDVGAATRVI